MALLFCFVATWFKNDKSKSYICFKCLTFRSMLYAIRPYHISPNVLAVLLYSQTIEKYEPQKSCRPHEYSGIERQ